MPSDALRAVARLTLYSEFSDNEMDLLVAAFSLDRVRMQMVALGVCEADASDALVAKLYFSRRCSIVSPNAFFDESWYIGHYQDARAALKSSGLVSGFVHFIRQGLRDGRWPNGVLQAACAAPGAEAPPKDQIDAPRYLARNPAAVAFLEAFPGFSALEHYNAYGRFLGYALGCDSEVAPGETSLAMQATRAEFDPAYYAARYLRQAEDAAHVRDPFQHYVECGMRLGHSPNAWFQEDWYRAFYKEVREAIEEGWLPSGFYHYVMTGRVEGRQPRYDLTAALEAHIPGLTDPALLTRTDVLRRRIAKLPVLPRCREQDGQAPTLWLLLPMLNPDIVYGGYRTVIELVCALRRDKRRVAIVSMEEAPNKDYFLWGEPSRRIEAAFADVAVLALEEFLSGSVGRHDLFMAYAVWDLRAAQQLAALTVNKTPLLLLQEYEPIFHPNGAQRALCEECYDIPHYPVINSGFLKSYLESHRIGVFGGGRTARERRHYAVFEHRINQLPGQTAKAMAARRTRTLAVYARPEAHAGRNLFEIVVLALQEVCTAGAFGPEWCFVGVGALSKLPPVQLGGGHELVLRQKLPEEEYRHMMDGLDIGLSLMAAPHPSVMPFEFATTGALVITNTYENRSSSQLRAICGNIIPCGATVSSLALALYEALARVGDAAARERNCYRPPAASWDDIFSPAFVSGVLENAATQAPIVVDLPVKPAVRTVNGNGRAPPKGATGGGASHAGRRAI